MRSSLREQASPRAPLSGYVTSVVGALVGAAAGVGAAAWLLYLTSEIDSSEDFVEGFTTFILVALLAPAIVVVGCALGVFGLLRLARQPAAAKATGMTLAVGVPLELLIGASVAVMIGVLVVSAALGRHLSLPVARTTREPGAPSHGVT